MFLSLFIALSTLEKTRFTMCSYLFAIALPLTFVRAARRRRGRRNKAWYVRALERQKA